MNVDIQARFRLAKVKLVVREKDEQIIRRVQMELIAELDPVIAKALGDDAVIALKGIQGGGVKKTELEIDGIKGHATLKGDAGTCKIPNCVGVKAVAKKTPEPSEGDADEDDAENDGVVTPIRWTAAVALTFEFPFAEDSWLYLGKSAIAWVDVTVKTAQGRLPFPGPRALGA
jgi:hypothetical protein